MSPDVNDESVPVPPDAPLHAAGAQRVTVCGAPDLFTHVTVPPTVTLMACGTKQKDAQFDEMVIVRLLAACARAAGTGVDGARLRAARRATAALPATVVVVDVDVDVGVDVAFAVDVARVVVVDVDVDGLDGDGLAAANAGPAVSAMTAPQRPIAAMVATRCMMNAPVVLVGDPRHLHTNAGRVAFTAIQAPSPRNLPGVHALFSRRQARCLIRSVRSAHEARTAVPPPPDHARAGVQLPRPRWLRRRATAAPCAGD